MNFVASARATQAGIEARRAERETKRVTNFYREAEKVVEEVKVAEAGNIIAFRNWRVLATAIARKHGFTLVELCSQRRTRSLMEARREAYYALHIERGMSSVEVGRCLGGRDHTSVLNGVKRYRATIVKESAG